MAKNFLDPEGLNLYTQALINGGLKVGKAQDSSFANDASTAFYASHADAEGLLGLIPMENIPIDAQNVFIGEYGVTTYDDIIENINNGKIVFIKQESSNMLYTLVNSNSTFCSFANVRTGVGGWPGLTATEIWVNSSSVWDSSFYQLQDYISDLSNIRSKANNALPKSGGQMTGDIDLNGNALLVRKSGDSIRNGIWFTGEGVREGIYVGNPNMRLFLEADPNLDLIHKKGGDFYDILDTNNVATKGNIYQTTWGDTLDNIINAVNAGKIVILKRDITYNEQKYSPTYVLNCFVKRVSDDYITECRFYARLEDNVVAEIACKRGPTWVDNGVMQLQENLVSGTNIKTINGNSVLGSGNIDTHEVFIAEYGVTNPQDVFNAIEEGKLVIAKKSDVYYQPEQWLSETSIRFVGFGYLNNFNFFDLNSTTWGNVITYKWQRTDEKVSTITGNIDNTKYPTTKAVTDYAQPIIDSSNKLSADLVDDSSTTHKFVSTEEKAEWDAKLPLSGGTMTGNIDLNGHALLVRNINGERPGIQFRGSGADEGVYVGNGNMRMILETGVNDTIRHKEGDNYYVMLDSHNTKTINGQSLLGAGGNIDINSVFFITYGDTTVSFSDIVTAYNDGKIIIAKHEGDIFMPISATITNDNIVAIFFGSVGFFDGEANILSFYVTESGYSAIGLGTLQLEINETNKLDADLVDDSSSSNKFVTSAEKTTWNDKQDAISDLSDIRSKANGALQRSGGTMTGSLNLDGKALLVSNDRRAIEFTGSGNNQGVYVGNANMRMILETGSGDTIRHKHRENNQDVYHVIFDEGNTKTINGTSLLGSGDIPFPDVSEFITKSVNDLLNYYTKQNTYTQAEVDALIGSIQHFHYEIYTELPQSGESNVLYLIGPAGSGKDRYEEYVYANNSFTKIGDTSIDLSNYITTQALTSALQQFAQDLQTELNNYVLKSQIKTVNENSLIGSGDVSIHPEIVNLTDGEHSSSHYEDLMRTVDKLKLNTPQIFLYTAYNNNLIATTAMCFSTCTNTESPTTNAVIKQTLFLGTNKSIRTLSNTVEDNKYKVLNNGWAQILDIKQSDLDSKVSRAGSSMTGNLNMDYHELQVAGNRNGIKFESNATGVLVGNGNMYTTIQSDVADLKHRKGSTDYTILDTSNVKTINGTSINGSGDIDVNNVFWVEYYTTPFADILAAYNAGKVLFANCAGYKFVNIAVITDNNTVTTFVFSLLGYDAEATVTVIGFTVSLDGDTTIYSNISTTDMQTLIDSSNKLSADFVDDSSTTHKFVTSAQTETWDTVTEKAPLPFVVTVSISPAGDVTSISHTISEINAAYSANKQLRLKCTNVQQSVWFEEDLTIININQSAGSHVYVSHTVTDDGTHYIITIYDDSGTTKARFETVDDKAYAKYNDVLINSITPTITSSTVTIDGYTLRPSEETFVVKPYQKIAFSDTNNDCHLYIIDATNPTAKTVISSKNHLIIWDNQSDTDITIQVGISNDAPGTLNVSTYWRGVDNVFVAEYNVTSISEIQSAVDSGRVVMCRAIESGNIVYYQLSQSSSASFTFFRFVGARYYRITLNKSTGVWSTSDDYLQSTSNRDSSIDSSASTTHYPSTKAVYDFVIDEINKLGEIVTVGATSDVGDVGSTATLTIKVAGSVVAQGTGTVTATISRGQEYVVEAERVYDYITPAPQTFTAANPARTVTMNYAYIPRDTITINQTESDEHAMITGNVQGNVIKAIRNASHLYLGTQTETGNQLICQLQDLDGTKYSDGTSAALDGSEGDQWLKLPVFWWKVTPIGTADADGAYDEYSFSFAFAGEPDLTWKKWEGDTNLLGAKKMYVSDGKGYSRSGVIGTANFTQATGNGYASARGTGYSCVTWEWQWMMCILFYAWYGRMNSQTQCGAGSNTNTRTLGTKDSLGMTDTTSSNGSADNTKFWGIENWWGDIAEWIGNVTMQGYVLTLTDMNTKQSRTVSGWYQFGGTGGYASRFKVTENIDFIPTAKNGTDSTCYCDWVNGNSGSRVVCRSSYHAYTYGGVAYVSAYYEPSVAYASIGSRLAFNGAIVEAESVAAYKAALSV